MKFKPEFKAKLVAALRSGDYKQGRRHLRSEDGFCCLGVACDMFDPNGWVKPNHTKWVFNSDLNTTGCSPGLCEDSVILPANVAVSIIETCHEPHRTNFMFNDLQAKAAKDLIAQRTTSSEHDSYNESLAAMNDSGLFTFDDIADFIERYC